MSVAIVGDGTWLATASDDRTVRIWDRVTGTCTATLAGHTGPVMSVAIVGDGTWLATTSSDTTVRIWNALGRSVSVIARAEGQMYSCAWGPARELAVAGARGLYLFKLLS
jgi:WD40 repeat protein